MQLWEYVVRRLLPLIPVMIGVSILTFSISHIVPSDPARAYCGLKCPDETLQEIKYKLHFEDEEGNPVPLFNQYIHFVGLTDVDGDGIFWGDWDTDNDIGGGDSSMTSIEYDSGGLLDGNWGYSLSYKKPVSKVLEQAVPVTLEMSFGAILIGAPLGIFLGVLSAVYQDRLLDHSTRFIAIAFVSLPIFWLALMFQYLFATKFGICDPIFGTEGGCFPLFGRKPPGSEFPMEGGVVDIGNVGFSALFLFVSGLALMDFKVEGRMDKISDPETTRDKIALAIISSGALMSALFYTNPMGFDSVTLFSYEASGMYTLDSLIASPVPEGRSMADLFSQSIEHHTLPIACLSLGTAGGLLRYMRSSLLEVMNEDYVRTARAKGLNERTVILKHGARNALIPVVTILGFMLGGVLGGAVLTETIFSLPGMGMAAVRAITGADFSLIMGVTIITSIIFLLSNLVVDIAYAWIDPRVRLG